MARTAPAATIRVNGKVTVHFEGGVKMTGVVVGPKERKVTGRRIEYFWPVRIPELGYTQRFAATIVRLA